MSDAMQSLLDLAARLRAEADRIEAYALAMRPEVDGYFTSICPPGYDTVLGFLAKTNPECLDHIDKTPDATQRDGFWLTHRMKERGQFPVKVPACEFLRGEHGIETVNAYPVSLLKERLG